MIEVVKIKNELIAIKGIGRLFYQDGFPVSLTISELKEKNIKVSLLHIADECLKHGWSPKTTYINLKNDFLDDIYQEGNKEDRLTLLKEFCDSDYEKQRSMIFNYLFGLETGEPLDITLLQLKSIIEI